MAESEQRHISRDSLFVLAGLRLAGDANEYRVKLRNLSAGGLMAEGDVRAAVGTRLTVEVRNVGWVEGTVAWVHENRFGVAFAEEIDPLAVRASTPSGQSGMPEYYMRKPLASARQALASHPGVARKI